MKLYIIVLAVFLLVLPAKARQQMPPVGTIDFYGLRTISEKQIRDKLQIKEGDAMLKSKLEKIEIEKRLAAFPGVAEAKFNAVCCTNEGKTMLYIGVREKQTPPLSFRPAPNGTIRLTDEIMKLGNEFTAAHQQAVLKGDVGEDVSQGHSLMKNSEGRAIQEKFIPVARNNFNLLRRVLRESADAEHRALAAEVIAYYANKSVVVPELVEAMKDADSSVRNNAMRALGLIAGYGLAHPEANIKVPFEPFVDMLNSIEWTDRNKSSLALDQLTEKRNSQLLELLRRKAISPLIEMARWKNEGHAKSAFFILGRIMNVSDDEIGQSLMSGKREDLIAKAQKKLLAIN